jgi:DNA-binding NarL/FixJ family response regulator
MSHVKTRVLLVDDHKMVLDSLSMLLSSSNDYQIVAAFTSGREVVPYIRKNKVDLIITDSRMPEMSGLELCKEIFAFDPNFKVIMISMIENPSEIRAAMDLGIRAYLPKSLSADELLTAIGEVLLGKRYLSNEAILTLNMPPASINRQISGLTGRELEIIKLIAQELSTIEIAERLFISVATVETHRKNLMQKTGAKSAIGLVLFAIKHGLLD